MSATFERAGQYELTGRRRLTPFRSFAGIEGEQDGELTFLAANAKTPSRVGLEPLKNIHSPYSIRSVNIVCRCENGGSSIRHNRLFEG